MSNNLLQNNENKFYIQLYKDYHKTKEDLNIFIDIIRKWAETQPHFPEKPKDSLIRSVILYNKFSIEKAKQKLDMFYTIRYLLPEFFHNNPLTEDRIFQRDLCYIIPLPKQTDDYIRIVYHQMNLDYQDTKYFNIEYMITQVIHLLEYMAENDLCYRYHYICDLNGSKLGHASKCSPMALKKCQVVLEKVFSNRMASLYVVNFPQLLEQFFNTMIKPIVRPKLRDRIHIYSDTEILFKVFGKERLPVDIGGEEKSVKELNDMLHQQYELNKGRFLELEKLTIDETLRPEKLQNDEVLGYYGSFRKVDID